MIKFNSERHSLGKLCKNSHDWEGTGQSLRSTKKGTCLECTRQYQLKYQVPRRKSKIEYRPRDGRSLVEGYKQSHAREYYLKHRESIIEQSRVYRSLNAEKVKIEAREYYLNHKDLSFARSRVYRKLHAEKLNNKAREKYHNNIEVMRERSRIRMNRTFKIKYAENPEYYRNLDRKYRARKNLAHTVSCSKEQRLERFAEFDNQCAYCGTDKKITLDHFLPLRWGGSCCLGNYLPACHSCNASKRDRDPGIWFKSQRFYSKERWLKILKALNKNDANYNQLPLF